MTIHRVWACVVLGLFASGVAGAQNNSEGQVVALHIEAQSVRTALQQFGEQTGLQVSIRLSGTASDDVKVAALLGRFTVREGLERLLANTGLKFEFVNENSVRIVRPGGGAFKSTGSSDLREEISPAELPTTQSHLRQAQSAPTEQPGPDAGESEDRSSSGDGSGDERQNAIEEIVVTGTHIRGGQNKTAEVIVLDRDYIERSGFSNTMQVVEAIPQNFKGGTSGASEEATFANYSRVGAGVNLSRGVGFNLRGLGSESTLTLVNGHRMAPSGYGTFVDVSMIPITAIERIEILPDGASAIYGADAIAGVVNIILRQDFEGAETTLSGGTSSRGGASEIRASQAVGMHWDSGSAMLMGEYNKRDPLDVRDRDFILDAGATGPTYLLPKRDLYGLVGSLNQKLPGNFDFATSAVLTYEHIDSFTSGIGTVSSGISDIVSKKRGWTVNASVGYSPVGDWRFVLEGSMGADRPDITGNKYDPAIGTSIAYPFWLDYVQNFKTWDIDLRGDGTLFHLPSGAVRMAIGASYHDDHLRASRTTVSYSPSDPYLETGRSYSIRATQDRNVRAAYAELYVPLVGENQHRSWARRLELSLAGRYDEYSNFGNTTNPRYGLAWSPMESLDFRASYSTSFRAPAAQEEARAVADQFIYSYPFDAADGTPGVVPFLVQEGGLALGPETSRNRNFGLTWRPAFAAGLQVNLNYYNIDYSERITTPPFDTGVLSRLSQFGDLVSAFPNDAAANAYLNAQIAAGAIFYDFLGTGDASGVRYLYDFRTRNASRTRISGYDVASSYTFQSRGDTYNLNLSAAHIFKIRTSLTADSLAFQDLNHYQRPLAWRARAMGTWTHGGLSTTLAVNYSDKYINDSQTIVEPIASWTTVDLNLSYALGAGSRFFRDTKLGLNITNAMDKKPPFATDLFSMLGFDVSNANAMGRYILVQYSKRW